MEILSKRGYFYRNEENEIIFQDTELGKDIPLVLDNDFLLFLASSDMECKDNAIRKDFYNEFNIKDEFISKLHINEDKPIKLPILLELYDGVPIAIFAKKFYYSSYTYDMIHKSLKLFYDYLDELNNNNVLVKDSINTVYIYLDLFGLENKLEEKHIIKKIRKVFNLDTSFDIVLVHHEEIIGRMED